MTQQKLLYPRSVSNQVDRVLRMRNREKHLRFGMCLMIHVILATIADPFFVMCSFGLFLVSDYWLHILYRRRYQDGEKTEEIIKPVIFAVIFNTLAFCLGAISLSTAPNLALNVTAIIWAMGIATYSFLSNTTVASIFWSTFGPSFLVVFVVVTVLTYKDTGSYFDLSWAHIWAILIGFIAYALMIIKRLADHEAQLVQAREEARERFAQLEILYKQDTLTGLLNRKAFEENLQDILSDDATPIYDIHFYLVDLNRFKPINDSYGHPAGDALLVEISRRMQDAVDDCGFAARLGGDEFAVIRIAEATPDDAQDFGYTLLDLIKAPVSFEGKSLSVGCSIGIVQAGKDGTDIATLGRAADRAMYVAKLDNRSSCVIFDAEMMPAPPSLADKSEIETAIRSGKIRPFYQPKVDMRDGKIIGMEALARWDHIDRGIVSPANFIPQIHDLGLQSDFTYAIARQVLSDIQILLDVGLDPGHVAINLTEASLATEAGRQDLLWLLSEYKEAARHVTVEVTEDIVLARASEFILDTIMQLSQLGVRISLDDFGTGYASFQHLQKIRFDELKIDTSFVAGLGQEDPSEVIIQGFLAIATGLDAHVVAEGVETPDQRDFLLDLGCYEAQGYLYSRPVTMNAIVDLLKQGKIKVPEKQVELEDSA